MGPSSRLGGPIVDIRNLLDDTRAPQLIQGTLKTTQGTLWPTQDTLWPIVEALWSINEAGSLADTGNPSVIQKALYDRHK